MKLVKIQYFPGIYRNSFLWTTNAFSININTIFQKYNAFIYQNSGFLVLKFWCHGFFSLGISMPSIFVPWKNASESRCRHLVISISRYHGVLVPESRCHGFFILLSRCCGFLVLRSRSHIYASTASFLFSLNLWCHIIDVHMWDVN